MHFIAAGTSIQLHGLGVFAAFELCELDIKVSRLENELALVPNEMKQAVAFFQLKQSQVQQQLQSLQAQLQVSLLSLVRKLSCAEWEDLSCNFWWTCQ